MIETSLRKTYQKICIDPLLAIKCVQRVHPNIFTFGAFFSGMSVFPLLAFGYSWVALSFMLFSGFLDTLDGSAARLRHLSSPKGAAMDIISDRTVECAIVLGLAFVDLDTRGLPALLMLGSILICVTSFLVVGVFTENQTEKSFYYSPGLIERAEAFIFFTAMILFPSAFFTLACLFSFLVFTTACIRMYQFLKN